MYFFFKLKGLTHSPTKPILRFIDVCRASEIVKALVLFPPFCRGRNSDSQFRSWVTYINKAYWKQGRDSRSFTLRLQSLENTPSETSLLGSRLSRMLDIPHGVSQSPHSQGTSAWRSDSNDKITWLMGTDRHVQLGEETVPSHISWERGQVFWRWQFWSMNRSLPGR